MLDASSEKERIPGFKPIKDKTKSMILKPRDPTRNAHRFAQFISESAEHRKLKQRRHQAHAAEKCCLNYFVSLNIHIQSHQVPVTLQNAVCISKHRLTTTQTKHSTSFTASSLGTVAVMGCPRTCRFSLQ